MRRLVTILLMTACGVPPPVDVEPPPLVAPGAPPAPRSPPPPLLSTPRMPVVRFQPYRDARWLQGHADGVGAELLVHWEPWCPHCKDEIPRLAELGRSLPGLEVIAVATLSQGATERQAREYLAARAPTVPAAVIPEATRQAMSVTSVPYAVLLRDGHTVWRGHPGQLDLEGLRSLL